MNSIENMSQVRRIAWIVLLSGLPAVIFMYSILVYSVSPGRVLAWAVLGLVFVVASVASIVMLLVVKKRKQAVYTARVTKQDRWILAASASGTAVPLYSLIAALIGSELRSQTDIVFFVLGFASVFVLLPALFILKGWYKLIPIISGPLVLVLIGLLHLSIIFSR